MDRLLFTDTSSVSSVVMIKLSACSKIVGLNVQGHRKRWTGFETAVT